METSTMGNLRRWGQPGRRFGGSPVSKPPRPRMLRDDPRETYMNFATRITSPRLAPHGQNVAPRFLTRLSHCNSRSVMLVIFGSSPRGISGSFGRERTGDSRRRCRPGTSPGGCAARQQLSATRENRLARSHPQRPSMRSNAWPVPIDSSRQPLTNGTLIRGYSIRLTAR
jgi:hypothetical protein